MSLVESDGTTLRSRTTSEQKRLAKYGATFEPPRDDALFYPHDDDHTFFARGRDFESIYVNHKYTTKERETLATYESLDYLPSHSEVYKHWLKRQPRRLDWDRWIMMGLIGFAVGFIGFLLHQLIDVISDFKWEKATQFIQEKQFLLAWLFVVGYSLLFVIVSAALVVFFRPSAGSSGIPEVIAFLNGTIVRHIFNVKTLIVKFFSCACAVAAGMPVGPEGPMIHMGSLVGAGLSQFKSDTLKFKVPFFERFRNSEDRRNFISAGAGAGIASAFGAPVGGLLFSMEEVSSFWNMKLSWQIFFCCMISAFTTDLFNSAFEGFQYKGDFGLFKIDKYILFHVNKGIAVNILAFIPSVLLGGIGGILGAFFTFLNLKIARVRKRFLSKLKSDGMQKFIRLLEPAIIMCIFATISVFLPAAFGCSPYTCIRDSSTKQISPNCLVSKQSPLSTEKTVEPYTCPQGVILKKENYTFTNKTFNQVATLMFVTGEEAIHHLFSRNTHLEFDYGPLFVVLGCYFFLSCWSAGTSISSGLVVPMLFIGGLYGRIVGHVMVSAFGVHDEQDGYWAWMDPGAFALIGAASFFGGVSRLTMSLTVIMMEITNDIQFLLLIMVAIMVAKWVGDFFTHPLYHALLELKCMPFLDAEPVIVHDGKETLNLELFQARHVMSRPPVCLHLKESASRLAHLLLETPHGGFPVIKKLPNDEEVFFGFINRLELAVLLKAPDTFVDNNPADIDDLPDVEIASIDYEELTLDKLENPAEIEYMLQEYCDEDKYDSLFVNLLPYVNQSAVSLLEKFSLHRTYIIFRTLGLRHLTIVNEKNHVVGIVTRKDLMGFSMEEKLSALIHSGGFRHGTVTEMEQRA